MSFLILKKGTIVSAKVIKVAGTNVTYEYTDKNGINRRASSHTRYISKYTTNSIINIRIYKGRSTLVDF